MAKSRFVQQQTKTITTYDVEMRGEILFKTRQDTFKRRLKSLAQLLNNNHITLL